MEAFNVHCMGITTTSLTHTIGKASVELIVTNSVAVVTNSAAVTLKHEGKVIQEEQFSEA